MSQTIFGYIKNVIKNDNLFIQMDEKLFDQFRKLMNKIINIKA